MKFLRTAKVGSHPHPSSVEVAGFGSAGPIVAAARAIAGEAIDRAVVDTAGLSLREAAPRSSPSAIPPRRRKYLDLPGMLALGGSASALAARANTANPDLISAAYRGDGSS